MAGFTRILIDVDEPERGCRPGDCIIVDLPDGRTVRRRIVSMKEDGTIQVVPEQAVVIREPAALTTPTVRSG